MTGGQVFVAALTLVTACSWAVANAVAEKGTLIDSLNIGRALALPALAGGFTLLRNRATTLQNATTQNGRVVSGTAQLTSSFLDKFGDRLLVDDFYVLAVVAAVLVLVLYEVRIGNAERNRQRTTWKGQLRFLAAGLAAPNGLGGFAVFLVYLRS